MHEKFIARQPIFDEKLRVFAYELLFRASPKNVFEPHKAASDSTIVDSIMLFDLQALTGNAKAFVNLDSDALHRGTCRLLPPDRVILEILETVNPTPEIVQICADLCASGYTLALDDFLGHAKWDTLLPLVKFLKVDFLAVKNDARSDIAQRFRGQPLQLVAEKVETQTDMQEARALGYSFFQGYFFCKPAMVAARDIPGNKLTYIRLLEAIARPDFSFSGVEELLKQDTALVYKLLRYLNSSLHGLRSEIRSVQHAIALLGEREFRHWVSIVAMVGMAGDKPPELIRTALTRAYFCEEFSRPSGLTSQSSELFLMGLLSVTDALLDRPMEQIMSSLPVSPEVSAALCGKENSFRNVYDTLLAYERADWPALTSAAHRIGSVEACIPDTYQSAASRAAAFAS